MDESLFKHLVAQEENRHYRERANDLMVYRFFGLYAPITIQGKTYHSPPISLAKLKMMKSIMEDNQGNRQILDRIEMAVQGMTDEQKKIIETAYLKSVKERGVTALSGHKIAISMVLFPADSTLAEIA